MSKDRYPILGSKVKADSWEAAIDRIRTEWPRAVCEGSTGMERSWTMFRGAEQVVVAHMWETRFGNVYLRYASTFANAIYV